MPFIIDKSLVMGWRFPEQATGYKQAQSDCIVC
jgi:hypothetical protein